MDKGELSKEDIIDAINQGVYEIEKSLIWKDLQTTILNSIDINFEEKYFNGMRDAIRKVKKATAWEAFRELCPKYEETNTLKKEIMEKVEKISMNVAEKRIEFFKKEFKQFMENFIEKI